LDGSEQKAYKSYQRIVADGEFLNGKLAIRGTRFTVAEVLSMLAEGMSREKIDELYGASIRDAIPEVLRAAADAVDVPSRWAMSMDERVAELAIPGLEELVAFYGYFPSFHDAEVISLILNETGASRFTIHTWDMTDREDDEGYGVTEKHAQGTFIMKGIEDLRLIEFNNHQNVLGGVFLDRVEHGYKLDLDASVGLRGTIIAKQIRIEFEPVPTPATPGALSGG